MPGSRPEPSLEGLPRQLGKYTLVRRLATGGMAELFLAIQRSVGGFEKLIVIKRILPSMNQDRAFIGMLLHEARIAATLSHPNIVQIFDLGSVDGAYFIAMEHIDGEDLRAIVRQMKSSMAVEFPLEHALSIILGVCAGLAYAHEKTDLDGHPLNIVHRDVSPQNVLVTFGGDVKLVDFGIAKSASGPWEDTKSGRLKGKIAYMSPEQARGEPIDSRSDIFAAGVMLFELTTGRRLFKAASEYETFKLICERDCPLPSSIRPDYPPALEAIVMRALQKDPRERWQTAREMQGALEDLARHQRIGTSAIGLSQFMRSLFADKLSGQTEARQQDKKRADSIHFEPGSGEANIEGSGRPPSFAPTAGPRGGTEASEIGRGRMAVLALSVTAIAALTGVGVARWGVQSRTPRASVQAKSAAEEPANPPVAAPEPVVPPPSSRAHGAIAVSSSPRGASIFVNGVPSPETTPVTFGDVDLGMPCVITVASKGFEDASQSVTLTVDNPSSAISVVLRRRAKPRRAAGL
jgi:eukaryotic-like serine/threonine-protein kinase